MRCEKKNLKKMSASVHSALLLLGGSLLILRRHMTKQRQQQHDRPTVDLHTVRQLLQDKYNIVDCKIKNLPSYDDLNFHILTETKEYVFKFNLSDVQGDDLRLENIAMRHLAQDSNDSELSFFIPVVIPTVTTDDDDAEEVNIFTFKGELTQGRTYYVRLLTFIKGSMLAHVPVKERTTSFLSSVGQVLGRCDCSLSTFSSKYFIQVASERNHFWNLRNALRLQKWTSEVQHVNNRSLLKRAFGLFELHAGHLLVDDSPLRSQVTHQDGNDYNIIVRQRRGEDEETTMKKMKKRMKRTKGEAGEEVEEEEDWSMVGLIDFGDIVHTNLICNLAVALAYLCCRPQQDDDDDDDVSSSSLNQYALFVSSSVVQGYVDAMPLDDIELDVLWWCMIGRICHSLASSSHRQLLEPENKYLVVSEEPFWRLLHALSSPSFEENAATARERFHQLSEKK